MANEPIITICGNAVADAELRFTPSGAAVASFTVAVTPRTKQGESWVDGETTFYRCSAWRQMAEQVSETITKGMRLLVNGRLKTRSYETTEGEKRTSIEIDVDEVGPSLRYATAKVMKVERDAGGFKPSSGGTKADDPWGSAPTGSKPADDEPPF